MWWPAGEGVGGGRVRGWWVGEGEGWVMWKGGWAKGYIGG